jgi:hypothetical protein
MAAFAIRSGQHARAVAAIVILGTAGAGCSARPAPAAPVEPPIGEYEFEAQSNELRGTIRILRDTMLIETFAGYCEPNRQPDFQFIGYRCTGQKYDAVQLRLDRRNPLRASRWSGRVTVQRQRQVCAQEGRNQQGQRVCVRYTTETYEVITPVGGVLNIRPVAR